jgi:hypothetical protein
MKKKIPDPDQLLKELWSFLLYKEGKETIGDLDPRSRIKKGIWKDEGIDLTLYYNREVPKEQLKAFSTLFKIEVEEVRRGLLRRKREHVMASGVRDLDRMAEKFLPEGWKRDQLQETFLSSDILHPFAVNRSFDPLDESIGRIKVERRPQKSSTDITPSSVLRKKGVHSLETGEDEDLRKLYSRKTEKKEGLRTPSGKKIRGLPSLVEFIFSSGDKELSALMEEGSLYTFAEEGLKSQYMKALFTDMSTDPSGGSESASGFRGRFGRWLLESPLGDEVADVIVPKLLERLSKSSGGEAIKLEDALRGLMDPRSTQELTSLVFSADPEHRSPLIRLLGHTRDRAAQETLKKLMEFSTMETDRESAREALRALGVDPDD